MASEWINVAFTSERFIAVSYPLKSHYLCTVTRARIGSVVICVLAGIMNIDKVFRFRPKVIYDPVTKLTRTVTLILTDVGLNPGVSVVFSIHGKRCLSF